MIKLTIWLWLLVANVKGFDLIGEDDHSSNVTIQLVQSTNQTTDNPLLQSTYILMSSTKPFNGYYNYIFVTDLYGPQFLLLQSKNQCKLSVDFDALHNNRPKGSIKFLKKGSDGLCSIEKDTYFLMRMGGLLELFESNSNVAHSYDFDRGYGRLRVTNHSLVGDNVSAFNVTLSNVDANIELEVGYYGQRNTLTKLPNIPVGPLVALIEMQVKNLNVTSESKLAVHMSFATSKKNLIFDTTLNRFFSDLQTPGIFRTYNVSMLSTAKSSTANNTFLRDSTLFWKAVAYTDNPPRRSSQIMADPVPKFQCTNKNTSNLYHSALIEMVDFDPIQSCDCIRVDFVPLNRDACFHSTKYMLWSSTFGFTSYYASHFPVGVVSTVAVAYAAPLIVGMVLFLLSKTSHRNRSPSNYTELSDAEEDEDVDKNDLVDLENESLYNETHVSC